MIWCVFWYLLPNRCTLFQAVFHAALIHLVNLVVCFYHNRCSFLIALHISDDVEGFPEIKQPQSRQKEGNWMRRHIGRKTFIHDFDDNASIRLKYFKWAKPSELKLKLNFIMGRLNSWISLLQYDHFQRILTKMKIDELIWVVSTLYLFQK